MANIAGSQESRNPTETTLEMGILLHFVSKLRSSIDRVAGKAFNARSGLSNQARSSNQTLRYIPESTCPGTYIDTRNAPLLAVPVLAL